MKQLLKNRFSYLYALYLRLNYRLMQQFKYAGLSNHQIFYKIYKNKIWGEGEFNSGDGSRRDKLVLPYIEFLRIFLSESNCEKTIVDLGCGDFYVGERIVSNCSNYIACDVVSELIEYNKSKFTYENLKFATCDIVNDELPSGNIVVVRQVLQHLSNEQIIKVVAKLYKYQYLVITEHLPLGSFVPNLDKSPGPDVRLYKNSGVDLLKPPFSLACNHIVNSIDVIDGSTILRTTIYKI